MKLHRALIRIQQNALVGLRMDIVFIHTLIACTLTAQNRVVFVQLSRMKRMKAKLNMRLAPKLNGNVLGMVCVSHIIIVATELLTVGAELTRVRILADRN
jgi:hypothetical protein